MSHLFPTGEKNHEQITKTKDLVYLDEKNLETVKGSEEMQPLSQSDYQSLSSEIPSRDDCSFKKMNPENDGVMVGDSSFAQTLRV